MPESATEYTLEGLLEVINTLPMAIFIFDNNRRLLLANNISEKFTTNKIERLIGSPPGDVLGCFNSKKDSRGCGFNEDCASCQFKASLEQTLTNNATSQIIEAYMHLEKRGKRILRFSTKPLKMSGRPVALLSIEDLTREKRLEQVRLEKEKLATVLETTGGFCHELSQPLQVIMGYCEILGDRKDLPKEVSKALAAISREADKLARLSHDLNNITHYKTKTYLQSKIIDIGKSAGE